MKIKRRHFVRMAFNRWRELVSTRDLHGAAELGGESVSEARLLQETQRRFTVAHFLAVADLKRSAEFYKTVFDVIRCGKRTSHYGHFAVTMPGRRVV